VRGLRQRCAGASFRRPLEEHRTELLMCRARAQGDIKLLDLRTNRLLWETNIRSGVRARVAHSTSCHHLPLTRAHPHLAQVVGLQFDRKDIQMNKLLATTLDAQYDARSHNGRCGAHPRLAARRSDSPSSTRARSTLRRALPA
jgi:hypothetical protein